MITVKFSKYLFVEGQLAVLETGGDVEIIFEQETYLEENLEIMKESLKAIGRNDLVTKLEIYLAIGEYFNITMNS